MHQQQQLLQHQQPLPLPQQLHQQRQPSLPQQQRQSLQLARQRCCQLVVLALALQLPLQQRPLPQAWSPCQPLVLAQLPCQLLALPVSLLLALPAFLLLTQLLPAWPHQVRSLPLPQAPAPPSACQPPAPLLQPPAHSPQRAQAQQPCQA